MPDTKHLYLVRHGEATPKEEDSQRGLTDAGHTDVTRMAAWAAGAGIQVDEIRHSGKLRAQQTAESFAERLSTQAKAAPDLAPNDDVAEIAKAIESERGDIMLVGHLPFLERLVSQLVVGDPNLDLVKLQAGALVRLTQQDGRWSITCVVQPDLLP